MYRTYAKLEAAGKSPPDSPEKKVALLCGILSRQTGVSLVPLFRRWRLPIDGELIEQVLEAYGLRAQNYSTWTRRRRTAGPRLLAASIRSSAAGRPVPPALPGQACSAGFNCSGGR